MRNKRVFFILGILLILAVAIGIGYFYSGFDYFYSGFNYLKEWVAKDLKDLFVEESTGVNYLIAGVPYYGFYNLYFQLQLELRQANPTVISSVVTLLAYWGDKRFSLADLAEKFPSEELITAQRMEEFFRDNGYESYNWTSRAAGGELDEIRKFINSEKKVPLIIFQRASFEPVSPLLRYRVGIGVFDKDQKIIVHDYYFGNNYEISYDEFENMFQAGARDILAVWPSAELAQITEGPNSQTAYPARLETMDKLGELLVSKRARANQYAIAGDFERAEIFSLYEQYLNHPDFQYLPLAIQVFELSSWAANYSDQPDKMIEIITERILPLNHDLDQAPEGWVVLSQDRLGYPYYLLSKAYLAKGERQLAVQAYEEMKKIEAGESTWHQSRLDELEAALYQ